MSRCRSASVGWQSLNLVLRCGKRMKSRPDAHRTICALNAGRKRYERRTIKTPGGTIRLPDVEASGVTALGSWIKPSPFPGTPRWEWVITNMPVTAVTGMSAGFCRTRIGARLALRRAQRFWESYGYPVARR